MSRRSSIAVTSSHKSSGLLASPHQSLQKSASEEELLKGTRSRRKREAVIFADSGFALTEKDSSPSHEVESSNTTSDECRAVLRCALSQHFLLASHGEVHMFTFFSMIV